jgi:hypothetical protein
MIALLMHGRVEAILFFHSPKIGQALRELGRVLSVATLACHRSPQGICIFGFGLEVGGRKIFRVCNHDRRHFEFALLESKPSNQLSESRQCTNFFPFNSTQAAG